MFLIFVKLIHKNDSTDAHDIKKKKLVIKDELTRCRLKLNEMLK
jgi:hypothetical protein